MKFGINRIITPNSSLEDFFSLANSLEITEVEVRNDLSGKIFDDLTVFHVNKLCQKYNISISTINALQHFNRGNNLDEKVEELRLLLSTARDFSCKALVLCPMNEAYDNRTEDQSLADTINALKTYKPHFDEFHIQGLVEPLGFQISSLRTKEKAITAIENSNSNETYKVVHDTFHHYLAGEEKVFPDHTGLVHISGVSTSLKKEEITDNNRVLIDSNDIMGNTKQIKKLIDGGYKNTFSFEPFSFEIQKLNIEELKLKLAESFAFIRANIKK